MKGIQQFNGDADLASDTRRELGLPALTQQMFPLLYGPSLISLGISKEVLFRNSCKAAWRCPHGFVVKAQR